MTKDLRALMPSSLSMMLYTAANGLRCYQHPGWPVRHGLFTRHGGLSPAPWHGLNLGGTVGDAVETVRANHALMYEALGVNAARAVTVWQVHSADVVVAQHPIPGRRWLALADGLITDQPDTPLVMRFADCTPILFYDPARAVIGIAHAGWRGTVQGMAANMIRAMQQTYGCRPLDIQAWIGPSISGACFQVGEEVVTAVNDYFGTLDGLMRRDAADGTAYVDLWAANALDLRRMGVEQIYLSGVCTMQNTQDFFSHRGEQGRTGRFGALISL